MPYRTNEYDHMTRDGLLRKVGELEESLENIKIGKYILATIWFLATIITVPIFIWAMWG